MYVYIIIQNIIYRISHIISYHIISYHIISYHIISYHIISYHIISYHIISYHIISYHIYMYMISLYLMLFLLFLSYLTVSSSAGSLLCQHCCLLSFNLRISCELLCPRCPAFIHRRCQVPRSLFLQRKRKVPNHPEK